MGSLLALVLLLGAMFAGALAVESWRATRLRAWAAAGGWAPVDGRTDGGALLAHGARFSTRVRSVGLTFHKATADGDVWLAEHRAGITTRPADRWHTFVVVRVPGAAWPTIAAGHESAQALDRALPALATWPHGGDVAIDGEFVRWRRRGLLWPHNVEPTVARGRELAALVGRG